MKVNIGPHRDYISTHKIKCNYLELMYGDDWFEVKEEQYIWIDHLVVGVLDAVDFCLKPINKMFANRKLKVKYHNYDTWSLDHTLALIILPGLEQLKATNHGYAHVDSDDLPTACLKDASGEERWEWVMEEMIWAFNEIANDYPGEEAFFKGDSDILWTKVNVHGEEDPEGNLYQMNKGPNHTFHVDSEGRKMYDDRIQRGLNLFGKYYRSLWD